MLQAISSFLNVFHSYISLLCQNAAFCGNGIFPANFEGFFIIEKKKILSNVVKGCALEYRINPTNMFAPEEDPLL